MGCHLKSVVNIGLILAIIDLLHGVATLGFFGYQLYEHYICHWNHGIRWCRYYIEETNHSTRVNIGMGEGVLCIIFASLLILAFTRYKPWLAWIWLIKALVVIGINYYFIGVWLMQTTHHYHQFWDRHNYDQDQVFLLACVGLTLIEHVIMFTYCCVVASFTHKVGRGECAEVRKQRVPTMETDI